ncbi:glycosyltransferase family 1 protein [Flavobacterium sp.]|uniref:glycosyltransferase family 4 protein n=1 Tax=Flavobacterium sp. TaxID=239 RepID=UPI0022BF36D4|nr:glycosyltransferase family 1 protein [Flavobacterium sp.]MCZ8091742.1 glycosyltransferase family 1 protein [Flavobacterium sp.]
MKIGFDAKRFFHNKTGLGNYSRSLVKLLSDAYPDNDYFLFNPKKSREFSINNYSSKVIEVNPNNYLFKKINSLWRLFFISNTVKNYNIEIYHGLSGELPIGLSDKIKKIVTIHDLIFIRYPKLYNFFDRKIYYWKFKYAAKKADLIIAISEQTKKDIVEFLMINPNKIKVIYQGCQDVFKKKYTLEEKNQVIKKYGLPAKFILNVGTIEERKNLFSVVKSIKDIDIPLVIIGKKTSYYNEIHQYIIDYKMENRVIHLSELDNIELAIIYQLATIFVYPSIFEGFGIPIIEALYSKTPVITSNSGVFPEAGGPHSIYINPTNIDELKEKIILLLNNENLRNEVTDKGFEFVQKFNDERVANSINSLYLEIFKNDDNS